MRRAEKKKSKGVGRRIEVFERNRGMLGMLRSISSRWNSIRRDAKIRHGPEKLSLRSQMNKEGGGKKKFASARAPVRWSSSSRMKLISHKCKVCSDLRFEA